MKRARTLGESFFYAISGIKYTFKTQRNIKIHFITALLAIVLSYLLRLSVVELLAVSITIALVLAAEMVNTAIETVVDMYTKEYHPLAEAAKNVAAGAVLISAINAIVVGYLIYYKKIVMLLSLK
ncbi:MAG TPA: diacylglycerol kinase family protein [Thermoanaerobacterales bacterium]|jgi:diacylglycerol kinase (ATP)|nr:diacylglycerol kinase family protein [Thermoanaerobacterales bacterium]